MKRLIVLVIVLLLAACSGAPEINRPNPDRAIPAARLRPDADGTIFIELGATNLTGRRLDEVDGFEGRWQLRTDDSIRSEGRVEYFRPVEPDSTAYALAVEAKLEPGTYTLVWGAPWLGSLMQTFTVEGTGPETSILVGEAQIRQGFPPPDGFLD